MARLPILVAPNPALKQKAKAVASVDADVRQLMDDMLETMEDANGIGLAAPQVDVSLRVLVMHLRDEDEKSDLICMANPEIIWVSDDDYTHEEGCLSFPDQYADVVRPKAVRVKYLDQDNKSAELDAEGMLSVCVQHEMDHLDGILFVDHVSNLKRNMILRKLQKSRRGLEPTV